MARLGFLLFWAIYLGVFLTGMVKLGGRVYLHHILLLLLLASLAIGALIRGRLAFPRALLIAFGFLLVGVSTSLFASADLEAVRFITQLLMFILAVFLTYLAVEDERDLKAFIRVTAAGCAANAAAGLAQSVLWISANGLAFQAGGKFFRVQGLCVSPADYVSQLMVGLYVSSLLRSRPLRLGFQGTYVLLLAISMSRSALVLLALAAAIKAVSVLRTRAGSATVLAGMLVLSAAIAAAPRAFPVIERFRDIGNINYNIKRFVTYADVLGKITANPGAVLFGNGFGTYSFYHPIDLALYDNPHNIYLHLVYCMGVVGAATFLFLVGVLVFQAFRARSLGTTRSGLIQRMAAMVLTVHLCTWLVGLVETNVTGVGTGWLLGSVFGLPATFMKKGGIV